MRELNIDELIAEAEKRNINLGEDSKKTISFYTKLGFISKPKRKKAKGKGDKATTLYYPASTIEKLAQIKALKTDGLSLDDIRESFALEYVQKALLDLLGRVDEEKMRQLATMLSRSIEEIEAIVQAPLIYLIEGMSPKEAKKLLTLFCGVGFYAMLEAQTALESFEYDDARRALSKAIFYNSIAVLRLARTTGDENLENVASGVYEKVVLEPIAKASEQVHREVISTFDAHFKEKPPED
ncbi:MAG: MerR family transcriptional regulator [Candidatus Dadabacteria bacterium]|nr:MerR family transcriptional regulator [Candidatus Dadabacteria bacterium]